jgi:dCTP deaminase
VTDLTAALADFEILDAVTRGQLGVTPFDPDMIRPAALSLRLGTTASVLASTAEVDAADGASYPDLVERLPDDAGRLRVHPDEVVLAATLERIRMPSTLMGLLDGISDVARLGLTVTMSHQVSPGFGQPDGAVVTLEIHSRLRHAILLHPGTRICNLVLLPCRSPRSPYRDRPFNHSDDERETGSLWAQLHS